MTSPLKWISASILAGSLILQGCALGKKLPEPRTIEVIIDTDLLLTSIPNPKYINNHTVTEMKDAFLNNLIEVMGNDNLIYVESGGEFVLVVEEMEATESSSDHTVDDPDSEFNGMTYTLHKCDVDIAVELYVAGPQTQESRISAHSTSVDKEEKVKNNRTVGDFITGGNQENNEYRHKQLSDDVFVDLHERAAFNLAGKVSTKLYNLIKKGEF